MISSLLLRTSVLLAIVGMVMGIAMGIQQDFALAPAHAHLNLLGFVALFLAGLYYRVVPQAAESLLARTHAALAIIGAVIFPIGIAAVLIGGPDRYEAFVIVGALTVIAGMTEFAIVVFRTSAATAAITAATRPGDNRQSLASSRGV